MVSAALGAPGHIYRQAEGEDAAASDNSVKTTSSVRYSASEHSTPFSYIEG